MGTRDTGSIGGAVRATGAAPLTLPSRPHTTANGETSRFSELVGARETPTQPSPHAPQSAPISAAREHLYGAHAVQAPSTVQSTEPLTEAGRRLLSRISRGERFVEQVVRGAASGAAYTPADLLAIQAQVYRYTQEVELVSKFVDRATNAVKTVLQQGS